MSILDLGTGPSRPSVGKKSTRIFLGFGLLVAVIGIGSTFASTISINADQNIEFGQGVQRSIFCGGTKSITVTPISTYANNSDSDTTFGLSGIRVSDIPKECSGKNFVIKAFGENGVATPLILASDGASSFPVNMTLANVWWANECPEAENECDLDEGLAFLSISNDLYVPAGNIAEVSYLPDSFTITLKSFIQNSNLVKKISIETQDDVLGLEGCLTSQECRPENT
jgi:hypothetical protein